MNRPDWKSILLPLVIVPAGGLLILAAGYLLYFGVVMLVESAFYADDPTAVPMDVIRQAFAAFSLVLYVPLLRVKAPDLLKAAVLVGPLTMLIITMILRFYQNLALAGFITAAIAGLCLFLLYQFKKPWFYFYAVGVSALAGIFYAWPRN